MAMIKNSGNRGDEDIHESTGLVTACYGADYRVDVEGRTIRAFLGGRFRIRDYGDYNPLAVGDRVSLKFYKKGWLITSIEERKNVFARKAPGKIPCRQVLASNLDQVLAVFSVTIPLFEQLRLDTILTAAEIAGIRPVIVFNKIDLLDSTEKVQWERKREEYLSAGYSSITTSAFEGTNMERLREILEGRMNVLSGPSGVGKSTLLNALFPGLGLKVRELARKSRTGRHATTYSKMFPLQNGGYVADTPGSRYFRLWGITSGELDGGFPEFFPYMNECRFKDCSHRKEPDCRVIEAHLNGEISQGRYESYLSLFEQLRK